MALACKSAQRTAYSDEHQMRAGEILSESVMS